MIVKLRSRRSGIHVIEDVYVGPDAEHLAKAGTLTLDVGQWQIFGAALRLGAGHTHGQLEVILEGDQEVVQDKGGTESP